MIKFEHGMLVLDNSTNREDVKAIDEFAEYVRNKENERIIKLLENLGTDSKNETLNPFHCDLCLTLASLITLIKGENNGK